MPTTLRLHGDMKSTGPAASLSIGEIAARFRLATHVLRHWESVGLLSPPRAVAGRRRYGADHLYRIAVILQAKEAGFGLGDIREMLAAASPAQRTEVLRRQREALVQRIAVAQASLELIDCALTCDHDDSPAGPTSRPRSPTASVSPRPPTCRPDQLHPPSYGCVPDRARAVSAWGGRGPREVCRLGPAPRRRPRRARRRRRRRAAPG